MGAGWGEEMRGDERLIVLDHGRIAETGNHVELLAKNGIYARLYNIQFKLHESA